MSPQICLPPQPDELSVMLDRATTWVKQAGEMALRDFKNVNLLPLKADGTLLTTTDLELEQFLTSQIRLAFPDHNLLAEESRYPRAGSPYTWSIDALDGTTCFVHGLPGWGISLGLFYQSEPVMGLYYMPLLADLTYATPAGAFCNGQPLRDTVPPNWNDLGFLAVSAGAHYHFEINIPRIRALGTMNASLIYTARGSATAAFIPHARLWDIAAGVLVLQQAGGELRYLSGRPVDLTRLLEGQPAPEPIVGGHPAVVAEVRQAISRKAA